MSRIGKKPITLPQGVEVKSEGEKVLVRGPKGELIFNIPDGINFEINGSVLSVNEIKETKQNSVLRGTVRAIISNMVKGVTEGFMKKLELSGIGYRAELQGKDLVLHVGFSHSVKISVPENIQFQIEKSIITISGIDKQKVGEIAAKIRSIRKPEPYKGTGIKYIDEIIKKKAGKKATATTT